MILLIAIKASVRIVEIFIKMREMLINHKDILAKLDQIEQKFAEHDDKILLLFKHLKLLEKSKQEELDFKNRKKIGYKSL